jgi:hypothetical protein
MEIGYVCLMSCLTEKHLTLFWMIQLAGGTFSQPIFRVRPSRNQLENGFDYRSGKAFSSVSRTRGGFFN